MLRHAPSHDDLQARAIAAAVTAAILLCAAHVLWNGPWRPPPADSEEERLSLRFVARDRPDPAVPVASSPTRPELTVQARAADPLTAPAPAPAPASAQPAASAPASTQTEPAAAAHALYADDGRVLLPSGTAAPVAADAGEAAARRLMERPNPVDYRETRFEKDWVSDGDLADVAAQSIVRGQKKIARMIFGPDIQHAEARPSPEVRFNPGRHERQSDLGSEATGDAYKAAPINYEQAPGLDGEASRRIRTQVAALEQRAGGCAQTRLRELMAPLLQHLDALQKAEAAFARGADPVRAEHMLPNQANAAYDGARRALWHAQRQLAGCLQ